MTVSEAQHRVLGEWGSQLSQQGCLLAQLQMLGGAGGRRELVGGVPLEQKPEVR